MMMKTPSNSGEESDTSSGIPTSPSSTKSEKSVPALEKATLDKLLILKTKVEELYLKVDKSEKMLEAQLQKQLELSGELTPRSTASKEEQPVSSGDTETNDWSVPSHQSSIANGDDEGGPWEHWDDYVPWHGESYMIIEKSTLRAMNCEWGIWLEDGEPKGEAIPARSLRNTWLCIEKDNQFLFFNKDTCRYIGCRDEDADPAPIEEVMLTGEEAGTCEFTARTHPRGGFELFLHSRNGNLRAVAVGQDNSHLHVRPHGPTLWLFRKVPSN